MKLVSLTRGYFAQVDDDDYEKINKAKWRAMPVKNNDLVYAGNQRGMMHRQIMQAPTGTIIDHIDGDGLNNQRSNLRFCTARQNFGNARKRKTKCSSTYKGVYARPGNTWKAECAGKYLGNFSTEVDAAIAYNKAAKTIYGEFARLNILPDQDGEQPKKITQIGIDIINPKEIHLRFKTKSQARKFIGIYLDILAGEENI